MSTPCPRLAMAAGRPHFPLGRCGTARFAALTVCVVTASAAHAEVYKCAGEGGAPVYQERPCPRGKELRNFQNDPPEITVLPGSPKADGATAAPVNARAGKDGNGEKKSAKSRTDKPRGDPSERRHLHSGMSVGEVLARVGHPDVSTGQKTGKQMRWTWLPTDGDRETVTTVTFVAGIVTNVERTLVKR